MTAIANFVKRCKKIKKGYWNQKGGGFQEREGAQKGS